MNKDKIEKLKEARDLQGADGFWNYDPYMQGLYNGLELALATMENREPKYKDAPDEWLMDTEPAKNPTEVQYVST